MYALKKDSAADYHPDDRGRLVDPPVQPPAPQQDNDDDHGKWRLLGLLGLAGLLGLKRRDHDHDHRGTTNSGARP